MRMRAQLFGILGVALMLSALVASPTSAWGEGVPEFRLPADNGYAIVVGGRGPTAFLIAIRPSRPPRPTGASSTYIAHGTVSSTAIKARFGSLGRVDVGFRPSGKVTRSKPIRRCQGANRTITSYGVFVGEVRFRGEGGYTEVNVHRVKGKVVSRPSLRCQIAAVLAGHGGDRGEGAKRKEAKTTSLVAEMRSGVTATAFKATTTRAGTTRFVAATERTEGKLGLYRVAFTKASPLTFAFDSALSFGSVTPPAPFSGTASLQRNVDGTKSWTGPLAVSFPGEPDVPLTGPEFKAQLARSW
jgi:hypothetical protein